MFHTRRVKLERRFAEGRGLEKFSLEGILGPDSKTLLSLLTTFLPLLPREHFRQRIHYRPVRAHVVGKTSGMVLAVLYVSRRSISEKMFTVCPRVIWTRFKRYCGRDKSQQRITFDWLRSYAIRDKYTS